MQLVSKMSKQIMFLSIVYIFFERVKYLAYTFYIFAEKDFLVFFFKRLRMNTTTRYKEDFPYLSLCGRERNFVRCDDQPIVYTHIIPSNNDSENDQLSYGGAGPAMTVEFEPEKICMLPNTGRVYYPAMEKLGGIGLIKSSLAIELSKHFEFGNDEHNPPTQFNWKNQKYTLTNELVKMVDSEQS